MKLYYVPQTRAGRPRWLLEEMEIPYELVRVDVANQANRTPEYLDLHPLRHVPVLVDGDAKIWESAAIIAYLADKYPDKKMAPPPGSPARGRYYQWMFYAMAELEHPIHEWMMQTRVLPEDKRSGEAQAAARTKFDQVVTALERELADGRQFILGEAFSAADVVLGATVGWARVMKMLEGHPLVDAYAKRLSDRPASKRARAD